MTDEFEEAALRVLMDTGAGIAELTGRPSADYELADPLTAQSAGRVSTWLGPKDIACSSTASQWQSCWTRSLASLRIDSNGTGSFLHFTSIVAIATGYVESKMRVLEDGAAAG